MYVKSGLTVNPVTPTVLFAGDYFGTISSVGIYRSTDGGITWAVSLRDVGVETLLVHPITPKLVFAGTVEDGLYRSADNGATWQTSLSARRVQAVVAAPVSGTLYAGASRDLHVSANDGSSWALASTLSSTITALAVHSVTPTHLYAGTRQHGLWHSVDGGTSWLTATVTGLPEDAWVTSMAIDPISPTILYAGVWQGNAYRSADGGTSWEDLGYLGTVQDVLIHPQEPSVIYAATSSNGVFRGSTLDHLTMAPVDSPQYVHHTFPITLTARDALSLTVPYTGTAILDDTTGTLALVDPGPCSGTLALRCAGPFVEGVWSGQVIITQPHPTAVIEATVGDADGFSNPFAVDQLLHLPLVLRDG